MAKKKEAKPKVKAKPVPRVPKKIGRPTKYTPQLAELICKRVASNTLGLSQLCSMFDDMPCRDTINEWRWKYEEFSAMYILAKQMQAETIVDELLSIANDGNNDWMEHLDDKGVASDGWRLNGEHVQRSRLRVDTGKWLAGKLCPRLYGDKILNENHNYNHEKSLKDLDE